MTLTQLVCYNARYAYFTPRASFGGRVWNCTFYFLQLITEINIHNFLYIFFLIKIKVVFYVNNIVILIMVNMGY